jgi:hypothetical protein
MPNSAHSRFPRDAGRRTSLEALERRDALSADPIVAGGLPIEEPFLSHHIFYNQSAWDGNSAAINPINDNAAIAPDKEAYQPGSGTAVYTNITSFSRGITGIMVDMTVGIDRSGISASDFIFKVGNNNSPATWVAAPKPSAISVVAGGGVGGSDRVEITWPSGSIVNKWLEVQTLATANTGLTTPNIVFWGNKVGDSGTGTPAGLFQTTTTDAAQVFASIGAGKPITDLRDYNRDGQVTSTDAAIVFANVGSIVRLNVPAVGPFAPEAEPNASASDVAIALAAPVPSTDGSTSPEAMSTATEHAGETTSARTSAGVTISERVRTQTIDLLSEAREQLGELAALDESLLDQLLPRRRQ